MPATIRRDGDALVFAGALDREACAALWAQARPLLDGVHRLELGAVTLVDSAGLALLAEIAERVRIAPDAVIGNPDGLSDLRAAYRLDTRLSYAG